MDIKLAPVTLTLLLAAATLGGCRSAPPPAPAHHLEVHADTLGAARKAAEHRAAQRCGDATPVVLDSRRRAETPDFRVDADLPADASEVAEYAAATHEGEQAGLVWRYRCE
ncbi:hypothetical protein [Modicisalibacter coralii]|uniref:hypothetical protein n=1 Tax=Modicisalibacter coralii TaxID=2304602 RepID=UPI00100AA707|nr:hypothetical protein [Halomonas coralii]